MSSFVSRPNQQQQVLPLDDSSPMELNERQQAVHVSAQKPLSLLQVLQNECRGKGWVEEAASEGRLKVFIYKNDDSEAIAKALSCLISPVRDVAFIECTEGMNCEVLSEAISQAEKVSLRFRSKASNQTVQSFVNAMLKSMRVVYFELSSASNSIGEPQIGEESTFTSLNLLDIQRLASFDISGGFFSLSACQKIATYLQFGTLIDLRLSKCRIDADRVNLICTGLSLNTSLRRLDLSSNPLGNVGMQTVARFLTKNILLEHVNLADVCEESRVNVDEGVIAISTALQGNPSSSVNRLNLEENPIKNEQCVSALSCLIEKTKTLTKCDFYISVAVSKLSNALIHNRSLKVLVVDIHNLDKEEAAKLNEAVRKSPTLYTFFCNEGPVFEESHARVPQYRENQLARWKTVAAYLTLIFERANRGHAFKHSILALLPSILNHLRNEYSQYELIFDDDDNEDDLKIQKQEDEKDLQKLVGFVSVFIDTRFYNSQLNRQQAVAVANREMRSRLLSVKRERDEVI